MKQTKKHALQWLLAGSLFSLAVLLVVFQGLAGKTVIADPEGIPEAADLVMGCIRSGDWETLEDAVSGQIALSPKIEDPDSAESILWEAYRSSLRWSCSDEFDLENACVTQKVTVTCLDIRGVTNAMAETLAGSHTAPEDLSHRAQMLRASALQILENDPPVMEREITLTFLREQGQWRAVPDRAFLALLSGFTTY